MKVVSFTKNGKRYDIPQETLKKAWYGDPEGHREAKLRGGGEQVSQPATPVARKLGASEAFKYYVKIKEGEWGNNVEAKLLNAKVGRCEGIAKAYRERAGRLMDNDEGRVVKEKLLKQAGGLLRAAEEYASQRDSLLGRYAHKVQKQDEYTEQQIIDMIDSGEFDDQLLEDIAKDTGIDIEELKGYLKEE